jgi:hypothetical protein
MFNLQRLRLWSWHNVGDDSVGCDDSLGSSPKWWWCGVLLCVLFVRVCLCVVALASARDVKLLLLLI